ncbi:MAG: hypothetical protein JWN29_3026 [Acidimicrobiales bacterium]|nr:hypothetical protein [Acidimicrobiales bacterium]
MTRQRLRVVVSGMMCAVPSQGGATWAVLQYILGLRRLGHEVWFVEPLRPAQLRPRGVDAASSDNVRYLQTVLEPFGLADRWALALDDGALEGPGAPSLGPASPPADVIFDVAGGLANKQVFERARARVYLDLDPCFTQMWQAYEGVDMRLAGHTHAATVGLQVGRPNCVVPTLGLEWIHTRPPVVLDEWPVAPPAAEAAWTTIANWRGYGSILHDGVFYGQKAHSVRQLVSLPTRTAERIEIALAIDAGETNDLDLLNRHGWRPVNPATIACDPGSYRAFIQSSKAEVGLAKSGYVQSRCGWFSDRSACYLASGRPVVVQDTGLSEVLPLGHGIVPFDDVETAAAAIAEVAGDYERHCVAAREFAETWLESDRVLGALLSCVGVT